MHVACRECQSIRQEKMTQRIRVIVADDHDCVRVGVMRLLQAAPHVEIVGEAPDTQTLAELLDDPMTIAVMAADHVDPVALNIVLSALSLKFREPQAIERSADRI